MENLLNNCVLRAWSKLFVSWHDFVYHVYFLDWLSFRSDDRIICLIFVSSIFLPNAEIISNDLH